MYDLNRQKNRISPEKKLKVARAIFVLLCLSAFVCNSYLLFVQFIEGSTILSTDLKAPDDGELQAPSILVCGKPSFKKVQLDAKVSDFVENSLKLEEFLDFSVYFGGDTQNIMKINVSDKWQSFYTVFFGSCHKLELDLMVGEKFLQNIYSDMKI